MAQDPEPAPPPIEDGDAAKGGAAEGTTPSVFVNSEPMREEQVENAVKFLSHPKVRGSPVIYRRSFLEKKGLTKDEIDEAFRRVPDPSPTVTTVQATGTNQGGQLKSTPNTQAQAPIQTVQPTAVAPAGGTVSRFGALTRSSFHWSHAFLAIGLLSASGAGTALLFKKTVLPRLKSWIRKVVLDEEDDLMKTQNAKPSLAEEAAAAAKAAAAAAADVAKASQEMVNSRIEEKRYFEEFMSLLDVQVQEMKSMSNSIRRLEGQSSNSGRNLPVEHENQRGSPPSSKQPYVNGKAEFDQRTVNMSTSTSSSEPSAAPHPKSYMDIMAMIQRGEKPSNIKEINDLPPNPNQTPSNPRLAPRTKPWEVSQTQNVSSYAFPSHSNGNEALNSQTQDEGLYQSNGSETSVPWWQKKNARITEVETEDEPKSNPYSVRATDRPVQRTWVPPQPPPVLMAEAAAAIRQPKSSAQREQLTDDQLLARASDNTDELQRITKISESGGVSEMNGGGSSESISREIQEGYEY